MIDMLPTRTVAPPAWLTAGKRHESPSMIVSMPATFGYHVGARYGSEHGTFGARRVTQGPRVGKHPMFMRASAR